MAFASRSTRYPQPSRMMRTTGRGVVIACLACLWSGLQPQFLLRVVPRYTRFARVAFDGGIKLVKIFQVFYPATQALKLSVDLADRNPPARRLSMFPVSNHRRPSGVQQHTQRYWSPPIERVPCTYLLAVGTYVLARSAS